jgi:hypothetical protein
VPPTTVAAPASTSPPAPRPVATSPPPETDTSAADERMVAGAAFGRTVVRVRLAHTPKPV